MNGDWQYHTAAICRRPAILEHTFDSWSDLEVLGLVGDSHREVAVVMGRKLAAIAELLERRIAEELAVEADVASMITGFRRTTAEVAAVMNMTSARARWWGRPRLCIPGYRRWGRCWRPVRWPSTRWSWCWRARIWSVKIWLPGSMRAWPSRSAAGRPDPPLAEVVAGSGDHRGGPGGDPCRCRGGQEAAGGCYCREHHLRKAFWPGLGDLVRLSASGSSAANRLDDEGVWRKSDSRPVCQDDGVNIKSAMVTDAINGIPRRDLIHRPVWKRNLAWLAGGQLGATKTGLNVWRKVAAPIEAQVINVTRGRVRLNFTLPMVVLTTVGARSGKRWEVPLVYFTDGEDVILIASNYGGERHPAWYHNLVAHPECELHIGPRGGSFVARETTGSDRDRLYALAVDRLSKVFALHLQRSGERTIPVMRLTPASAI